MCHDLFRDSLGSAGAIYANARGFAIGAATVTHDASERVSNPLGNGIRARPARVRNSVGMPLPHRAAGTDSPGSRGIAGAAEIDIARGSQLLLR